MGRKPLSRNAFLFGVAAFLVSLIAGAALIAPPEAKAGVSPPPYQDTTYDQAFWNIVKNPANIRTATWQPSEWAELEGFGISRVGGTLPPLSPSIGTILLAATAFDVGWKIGRTIDNLWLHLSGNLGYAQGLHLVYGERWVPSAAGTFTKWFGASGAPTTGFALQFDTTSSGCGGTVGAGSYTAITAGGGSLCHGAFEADKGSLVNGTYGLLPHVEVMSYTVTATGTKANCGTAYVASGEVAAGATCSILWMSEVNAEAAMIHSAPVTYTNQTVNKTTTMNPAPSSSPTSAGLSAARSAVSAASDGLANAYNCVLDTVNWLCPDPNTGQGGGTPIVWAAPTVTETYDQYLSRLRNLGWLGTVTPVTLADNNGDPEFIASGVPCTSVQTGATIGSSDPVTIYQNPAAFGSADPSQSLPACPGRLATSKTSNKCTFKNNRWASVIAGNESSTTTHATKHGPTSGQTRTSSRRMGRSLASTT
jgi:hypothetical protein